MNERGDNLTTGFLMRIPLSILLQLVCCGLVVSAERLEERPATDNEWDLSSGGGCGVGGESVQFRLVSTTECCFVES